MLKASAIIVAGGSGVRMGRPKQMLPINGKAVLARSVEAFKKTPLVKEIIVVTTAENFAKLSRKYKGLIYAEPGPSRIESLKSGLAKVNSAFKLVAVHDGARPLVSPKAVKACLESANKNKAAVLAVAVKDTIKEVKGDKVVRTLDRSVLYAAQTPQCYQTKILQDALKKYGKYKDATDESQLVEKLGVKVAVVLSSYDNIKITTPEDLIIAEALCKSKKKK
ncbi:MAG: 2-C-methyl-D-erythritol 4-phosphate cytidylyltransferase [Elusimicrobiota bacterium]|jgi:2-C-methyl-D-erythritol 4-phosphate cytidylyltransferase|nr:2-C-methyl-D-erythritol 4-phosphate cytidylyltransferase [Elusimicrobiota bacterium]